VCVCVCVPASHVRPVQSYDVCYDVTHIHTKTERERDGWGATLLMKERDDRDHQRAESCTQTQKCAVFRSTYNRLLRNLAHYPSPATAKRLITRSGELLYTPTGDRVFVSCVTHLIIHINTTLVASIVFCVAYHILVTKFTLC